MGEKGKFIVMEGIDGSGKSTHRKLLGEYLEENGYPTLVTSEPSHGRMGKLLREYLQEDDTPPMVDTLLFAADRVEHLEKEIKPALAEGKMVITERYNFSSMAYQAAQGMDMLWLTQVNSFVLMPDLVILLDLPPESAIPRTSTNEKFEQLDFLKKVYDNYQKLAWVYDFHRVNAERDVEAVQADIRAEVKKHLNMP